MTEIPGDGLEETRAALAPTLEATAAILPWLAKPRPLRFDAKLNERWVAAGKRLSVAWSDRHGAGTQLIRPAIFELYGVALETADAECLRLGEALASAADQLETANPAPRLIAALTACIECLSDATGLEQVVFPERARHFAQRLESSARPCTEASERSIVLDRLFVADAHERLEQMHDALATLPPDAYALKLEASELAQHAEHLSLHDIMQLALAIASQVDGQLNLDTDLARRRIQDMLERLSEAVAAVDV
jgi:hypothetical protein